MRVIELMQEWWDRRSILRESEKDKSLNRERDRFVVKDNMAYMLAALDRGDIRGANLLWRETSERYPEIVLQSPTTTRVLIRLGRFEEAEALMQRGRKKFPGDYLYAKSLADIAQARRDYGAAVKQWASLRRKFPGVLEGYTYGAFALAAVGQIDAAEALVTEAIRRFPYEIGGYIEHARLATDRKDWEEAARRWQPLIDQFGFVGGFVGSAQALAHLGRYDDAETLLAAARLRFGTESGPTAEWARIAELKNEHGEAVKRWRLLIARFPLNMPCYFDAAEAFQRLGEHAEAESTLRAAIERFENEPRPLLELAKLHHFRHRDYPAAAEAWAKLRERFPDNEEGYTRGAEALDRSNRPEEAEALRAEHRTRFPPD
jgi:tetratricopeptide (TPR) repeat protein